MKSFLTNLYLFQTGLQAKKIHTIFFIFLLLALLSGCSITHKKINQENVYNSNGIDYSIDYYLGQKIHIATVNLEKNNIILVKSLMPLEKPSQIARRKNARIAINAGFFQKDGSPAGALKIDNLWLKKPKRTRGVIGWNHINKQYYFDRLTLNLEGNINSTFYNHHWWENTPYIVEGAPLLIHNKQVLNPDDENTLGSFLSERYARSVACIDQNNNLMLILVEGGDRFSSMLGFNNGLTIKELTSYLQNKKCQYALNLDGGRSSTMVINNKVVNAHPHFFGERKVSNVIVVTPKVHSQSF